MYFIKAKDIVLSTAYESKETAENVVSEMKKIKALKEYTFEIVEKEIDTSKRGHKNTINEDIVKEALKINDKQDLGYGVFDNMEAALQEHLLLRDCLMKRGRPARQWPRLSSLNGSTSSIQSIISILTSGLMH